MSYVVEQKIKGQTYFFEATNHWCPEKKQSRQQRRYLGKKDPETGALIPARNRVSVDSATQLQEKERFLGRQKVSLPAQARDYGTLYLLDQLATASGLKSCLSIAFDKQMTQKILSLIYFQLIESKAWYLYEPWRETTDTSFTEPLTSQRISEFFEQLDPEIQAQKFFQAFARHHGPLKGAWLDISSISSYSKNNHWVEWGYNRDKEELPQINIGVLMGYPMNLPFFYQLYPGSIPDVSTLHNIVLRVKDLKVDLDTWIMDRGFFSIQNISHMAEQGFFFVTPLLGRLKECQNLLNTVHPRSSGRCFCLGKDALFYEERTCKIGTHTLRAVVYFNEQRRAREIESMIQDLESFEKVLMPKIFKNLKEAEDCAKDFNKKLTKYYTLTLNSEGYLILTRREDILEAEINQFGKMILVTNKVDHFTPKDLLEKYREKDRVEKVFDALKNEINEDRLRTHSSKTMSGKMFITFLSLILYTFLMNKLKVHEKLKKWTYQEILLELKKIRVFERPSPHPRFLSELTKSQKEIFEAFLVIPPH